MSTTLCMYAICDGPRDYPDEFIVRRWDIAAGRIVAGPVVARGLDLETLRGQLPAGLVRIPRHPTDDPVIVESWV